MLDDLKKFIDDLEAFDAKAEVIAIIGEKTEMLAELQSEQWMEGRGVDGEYIRPYYSENPYFKNKDAAVRYARWKQKITPNPERPFDVPNLYINGYLHSSVFAKVIDDEVEIDSLVSFADEVFRTHENAVGLSAKMRLLFAEQVVLPNFEDVLKEKTGLIL